MYLLGYHAVMKITPEFFRLQKIHTAHVTANMLVVHMEYAHPVIRALVTTGSYSYYGLDTITNNTNARTNTNMNTTDTGSTIQAESDSRGPGLCIVRYHTNEHEQVGNDCNVHPYPGLTIL